MKSRNSFAAIAEKVHADALNRNLYGSNKTIEPNDEDLIISEQIVEYLRTHQADYNKDATGEWAWLQQNKQANFIGKLHNLDTKGIAHDLANMFRTDATYGYVSPSFVDTIDKSSKVISNILCDIDTAIEFTQLKDIKNLAANVNVGNPFGIITDGYCILPDAPRHYYYSKKINNLLNLANIENPVIFEIGSGYGGLTSYLKKTYKGNAQIINIDLIPGLICSYYYLRKQGYQPTLIGNNSTICSDIGQLYLLPAEIFNRKTKDMEVIKPDLIFNSRSLCEMSKETCDGYIEWINKSKTKFFYHENSNYLLFPDSDRHIEILASDFKIDEECYDLIEKSITPFNGGSGRYREYVYKAKSILI